MNWKWLEPRRLSAMEANAIVSVFMKIKNTEVIESLNSSSHVSYENNCLHTQTRAQARALFYFVQFLLYFIHSVVTVIFYLSDNYFIFLYNFLRCFYSENLSVLCLNCRQTTELIWKTTVNIVYSTMVKQYLWRTLDWLKTLGNKLNKIKN